MFDEACLRVRPPLPAVAFQASAPAAVADLATRGFGVAILSESMLAEFSGRLLGLVVEDIERSAMLALVWGTSPSPAVRELLNACQAGLRLSRQPG